MRRTYYPLIALCIAAVMVIAVFWMVSRPEQAPVSIIPDEETPLGVPELASSEYESGYGITWSYAPDDPSRLIGYTKGIPTAELTLPGHTAANEALAPGMSREDAEQVLGPPITQYNRTHIAGLNTPSKSYYRDGDGLLIVYYDNLDQDRIVFMAQFSNELAVGTRFFTSPQQEPVSIADTEAMAMDLVNGVRLANGKAPLQTNPLLTAAARGHSTAMVAGNFFSHTDLSGKTMKDRLKATGLTYRNAGEALCAGTWTPMDAVMAWVNSPPHRDILLGDFTDGGIGVASGNTTYGIYYTLNVTR